MLLDEVNQLVKNSYDRGAYLIAKSDELVSLKKKLQDRLNQMIANLTQGNRAGPPLQYDLPTFPIDWNNPDWKDVTKPVSSLTAKAPGM